MESRHESIFIDNLTQEEKEKIEKVIKEVKPDVYIFDQSNSMTLNFDDEFLRHEVEFYREKYTESQKKEAMVFILSKFEDACVDGEFEGATDSMVAFIEEKLEEFDNVNKNAFKE